ncbi:hypothetical protein FQA47_011895 [Oryzias melastigma]|uniref:Uncharacterized protein n=1 Tax=Oryzias melastigma TaxID=30732 RepID=A0A834C966_ORYME|nr:hypothetical protein FQA47_011895 [Oryzias melastigma]
MEPRHHRVIGQNRKFLTSPPTISTNISVQKYSFFDPNSSLYYLEKCKNEEVSGRQGKEEVEAAWRKLFIFFVIFILVFIFILIDIIIFIFILVFIFILIDIIIFIFIIVFIIFITFILVFIFILTYIFIVIVIFIVIFFVGIVTHWRLVISPDLVFAEFHRINNVNLRNQFYKELDRHTPKLKTLFREKSTKTGRIAEELARLIKIYDLQDQRDVNLRRALVLLTLPVYLREDTSNFFKTCTVSVHGPDLSDTAVALLSVVWVILLMLPSSTLRASLSSWRHCIR